MNNKPLRTSLMKTGNYFSRPLRILENYQRGYLRSDLVAGLTIAVIMLPQAMAFAIIADLPPQVGLYTAIVGSIVGALWGSSNQLQTGPTNTTSLLVLSVLLAVSPPGTPRYLQIAGLLTVMVGVFRLVLGLARLGMLVNFVSDSVIVGFTAGAGLLIFFNQLRHLLRLEISTAPRLWDTWGELAAHIGDTHLPSLLLGLGTIILILLSKRLNDKLPGPLMGITLAGIITAWFHLDRMGVRVIGELPQSLPPLALLPLTDLTLIGQISTGALAVAAIGLVEAMSIARSVASHTGQRLDINQEFVGQGIANIASGIFSGYTCSGSFTRSLVNYQSGAKTSLSNVFSGIFVLIAMLLFGSLTAHIPLTAVAGIVILVAFRLVDIKEMQRIWIGSGGDRTIMIVTLLATLLLPLQFAVLTGILMSLAHYLLQTSTPTVRVVIPDKDFEYLTHQPENPSCPQLGIVEILGDLYFGAVHHIEETILENQARNPDQRFLLLRMFSVEHCDISGIHILESIVRAYRERGGDVFISRYQTPVLEVLDATGFTASLGRDHFLGRDLNAIGHLFYKVLERVFKECQNLPKRLDLAGEGIHLEFPANSVKFIEAHALWEALHQDHPPLVIDVREPREFKQGHIPQASLVPLPELLARPEQLPKDQPIVLLCRGGRRSTRAAGMLQAQGYENLKVLKGGLLAWEAANLLEAVEIGASE